MSFAVKENKFGNYNTVILKNESDGTSAEVALTGATLLSCYVPSGNSFFNVIDGFADPAEMKSAKGARSWIMIPFANRIPGGKYTFRGKEYQMKPIEPRTQVIHGFASYLEYKIKNSESGRDGAKVVLQLNDIRPGLFEGYPFSIDIYISFELNNNGLFITVAAENAGNDPAPFSTGWHPYFRTNDNGIENLILTLNSGQVIRLDENLIPLNGKDAYADIKNFPDLDFNDYQPEDRRKINGRKLDTCYSSLLKDSSGYSECSLFDPENGMQIIMFQNGGVTLAFSGDSLSQRKRKSVALEPMQYLTNAFNRDEFADAVAIFPGQRKEFSFGFKVKNK